MNANFCAKHSFRSLLLLIPSLLMSGCLSSNPYTSPGTWTQPSTLPDGTCPDISGHYKNVGQYPNVSHKTGPIKWTDPLLSCSLFGNSDYCGYKAQKVDQINIDKVDDGIRITALRNGTPIVSADYLQNTNSFTCKDGWLTLTKHGLWGNPMAFWFFTAKTSLAKSQGHLLVRLKSKGVEIPLIVPIISETIWEKFAPAEAGSNNSLQADVPDGERP